MKCLSLFVLLFGSLGALSQDFRVEKGLLDLRGWNADSDPVVSLDGEWEFHWQQLLLHKDLPKGSKTFARLSLPWNEQKIADKVLPKNGYATYALTILMPIRNDSVAFAVPAVFNSYAFWVNDSLLCSSGKVGKSAAAMVPRWKPRTVQYATGGRDSLHVIFQISNFQDTRGGCAEVMRIGNARFLTNLDTTFHVSGVIMIILFGVTSLASFIVFFIIRSKSFLFLSMLAMAYTIRFLFSDLYFYDELGMNVSWLAAARMEYVTIPMIVLCGGLFISSIYPKEFRRSVLFTLVIGNTLLMLTTLFVPSSFFSPLLVVSQVIGLATVVYIAIVITRALFNQKAGAWVSALGISVFAAVGFYNIYVFISVGDLNRVIIDVGYVVALLLNVISLLYRTPLRLYEEEQDMMRFSDFYNEQGSIRL